MRAAIKTAGCRRPFACCLTEYQAAVGEDGLAGDVVGVFRSQEGYQVGHVFRLLRPAGEDAFGKFVPRLFRLVALVFYKCGVDALPHGGVGHTRAIGVYDEGNV